MTASFVTSPSVAVLGGGPGGYEAALAAAQLGAEVTLVERAGVGGAAVITDVVPSKSLIATADAAVAISEASDLGVEFYAKGENGRPLKPQVAINLAAVNKRLLSLARQQSEDMRSQLIEAGVTGGSTTTIRSSSRPGPAARTSTASRPTRSSSRSVRRRESCRVRSRTGSGSSRGRSCTT